MLPMRNMFCKPEILEADRQNRRSVDINELVTFLCRVKQENRKKTERMPTTISHVEVSAEACWNECTLTIGPRPGRCQAVREVSRVQSRQASISRSRARLRFVRLFTITRMVWKTTRQSLTIVRCFRYSKSMPSFSPSK